MSGAISILDYIPIRAPFLMIDRVQEIIEGRSIVVIKNVTCNEWFLQGHFPGNPIVPGVIILEAMGQAGCVLGTYSRDFCWTAGHVPMLVGFDGARFRRPVVVGDQLCITVSIKSQRQYFLKFCAQATVDGQRVAEAVITCTVLGVQKGVHKSTDIKPT